MRFLLSRHCGSLVLHRTPDELSTQRFRELAWPHLRTVLRVAQMLVHQTADAEDLVQETMLKALRFMPSFREGEDAKAWLLTILRNARVDQLRRNRKHAAAVSLNRLASELPDTSAVEDAGTWEKPEELLNGFSDEQIIQALQDLPEDIRLTMLLVDVEQLSQQEAGKILDVPVGTVKSRLHRGRAMLREKLPNLARTGCAARTQ